MRARRESIMPAVSALAAVALFLVTLPDVGAMAATGDGGRTVPSLPDTLLNYNETIFIGPDGDSTVEIAVVIGKDGSGDLLLPFDFDDGMDFTVLSGPAFFGRDEAGAARPTILVLGRTMLNLRTGESAAAGDTVRIGAGLPGWYRQEAAGRPYGEFTLKRRYVNFSAFVMRDFRMNLVLPPGMVVHSIEKVVPDFDPKKNPRPPYSIDSRNNRVRAAVAVANLAPAAVAQLDLNIRPARRGLIPLIGGLTAAILYLAFFRDVLKPKETE